MADDLRSHRLGPPLLVALLVAAGPVQAQIVTGQIATFTGPGIIKTALLPPAAPLAEGPAITLLLLLCHKIMLI